MIIPKKGRVCVLFILYIIHNEVHLEVKMALLAIKLAMPFGSKIFANYNNCNTVSLLIA